MAALRVGCGQITWDREVPEEQVLAEIAEAGYDGAPARGGADPSETLARFARHGLAPAPAYLGAPLWDRAELPAILEMGRRARARDAGTGLRRALRRAEPDAERRLVCGDVGPGTCSRWRVSGRAEALNRVGEVTLAEGVRTCFHNHVGSFIETREEIDRVFALVDRGLVFQGPDSATSPGLAAMSSSSAATTPTVSRRCISRTSIAGARSRGGRGLGLRDLLGGGHLRRMLARAWSIPARPSTSSPLPTLRGGSSSRPTSRGNPLALASATIKSDSPAQPRPVAKSAPHGPDSSRRAVARRLAT